MNFLYIFNKYVTNLVYSEWVYRKLCSRTQDLNLYHHWESRLLNEFLDTVLLQIFFGLSKSCGLPFFLFYLDLIYHNNSALNLSSGSMYQTAIWEPLCCLQKSFPSVTKCFNHIFPCCGYCNPCQCVSWYMDMVGHGVILMMSWDPFTNTSNKTIENLYMHISLLCEEISRLR